MVCSGLFFFIVLDPLYFLISNLFWTIVNVWDASRGGVQVLFGHQNQWSPLVGSCLPWVLKCSVTGRSTLEAVKEVDSLKLENFWREPKRRESLCDELLVCNWERALKLQTCEEYGQETCQIGACILEAVFIKKAKKNRIWYPPHQSWLKCYTYLVF
jgi:hypothetical protein